MHPRIRRPLALLAPLFLSVAMIGGVFNTSGCISAQAMHELGAELRGGVSALGATLTAGLERSVGNIVSGTAVAVGTKTGEAVDGGAQKFVTTLESMRDKADAAGDHTLALLIGSIIALLSILGGAGFLSMKAKQLILEAGKHAVEAAHASHNEVIKGLGDKLELAINALASSQPSALPAAAAT